MYLSDRWANPRLHLIMAEAHRQAYCNAVVTYRRTYRTDDYNRMISLHDASEIAFALGALY